MTSLDVSANTALQDLNCSSNQREVAAKNGVFNLSTLPGFDVLKVSYWQIGLCTVEGTILTVPRTSYARYTYDCGNGHSETLWLYVDTAISIPAIPATYILISEPAEDLLNRGIDVYLDMECWNMTGAPDENGKACPRIVSVKNDTYYRDPFVNEDEDEAWVSAKYIYDTYLAHGMPYESYASSCLYILASSVYDAVFTLPAA